MRKLLSCLLSASPFYAFFAWILKVILRSISWQDKLPLGVAAMTLTVSQLVPEINECKVFMHFQHKVWLPFYFTRQQIPALKV